MSVERHVLFWIVLAIIAAYLLQVLAPVLLPFVVGLTLAYFLNPLVDGMSRIGIPRWLSAILLLACSILLIALALIFIAPVVTQQAIDLINAAPSEFARFKGVVEATAKERLGSRYPEIEAAVTRAFNGVTDALPAIAASVAQSVWSQGSAAFNFLSLTLITPLVFFYTVRDWPKLVNAIDSWLPREGAPQIRELANETDDRISAFVRGQGTVCLVLAIFYAAALSLVGLRYGLLVGLLTGFASFIPFVGWALGLLTATTLAVIQFWPDLTSVLIVVAILLAGQGLDAGFLSPNIVGSKIGLHPVWMIFALLTFSYLFGFLGLLVAVPVSAAIAVLVRFALRSYLASSLYTGSAGAEV